ncbi:MAG TPA: menaquinone biosynthesis protein [Candidatus Acidoferrum sp.]|nr:menaquinone biosynthesis protein [Candidatus Acidoferrum sp.]
MNSLRISIVQYLNTAPLVRGFTHGALRGKYRLSFTVPSQCADALRTNAADIAIIPAIEYARIPNLVVLPGLSIASKRAVRSLLLVSTKPVREVTRMALDRSSRSTQALVRILCRKWWGIAPEFLETEPDLPAMLQKSDAALLIGDPALRLALKAEPHTERDRAGALRCSGESVGFPGIAMLYLYDMVEEWRGLSGLPAVLAVWAARPEVTTPEVVRDFQKSLAQGLLQLNEISAEASREMGLPAADLRRYLSENIDYGLDEENLQGLRLFFKLAAELGLIPSAPEIVMARAAGISERDSELAVGRRR